MKEQILALAVQSGFKLDWAILNCTGQFESFHHAAIESYKAELLKEVGEPVGYVFKDDATRNFYNSRIGSANEYGNYAQPLFTSDQVAAAILKATGPLEKEIERLKTVPMKYRRMAFNAQLQDENNELRTQLAKAEQLWQIVQGRCDGLEEKLAKAEQLVAEACALACEDVIGNTANDQRMIAAIDCSAMIRSGEWRKFVKDV